MTAGPAPSQPRIGEYFLEQQIGQGGQSVVWLARSVRTGNRVAVKVLRSEFIGPAEIARLHREWSLLASLNVPGLPKAFDFIQIQESGVCALAMDYVAGLQLDRVQISQRLSLVQTFQLALELTRIVAELHRRGIVHRDIKPSNLLLTPGWETGLAGRCFLVDFGIANSGDQQTRYTATGSAIGTFAFMPPESLLGHPERGSPHVDVYALGVLFYSTLFGVHPTGLPMSASLPQLVAAHISRQQGTLSPEQVATVNRILPGFIDMIRRCVATEPGQRPENAAVLFEGFSRISVNSAPISASAPIPSAPDSSWTNVARAAGNAGFTNFTPASGPVSPNQQVPGPPRDAAYSNRQGSSAGLQGQPTTFPAQPQKKSNSSIFWILGIVGVVGLAIAGCVVVVGVLLFARARNTSTSTSSPSPTYRPAQPVTTPPPVMRTAIVVTSDRTPGVVRSGPGFTYPKLAEVYLGLRVTITGTGTNDGWIPVQTNEGYTGWMHRDILRIE